MNKTKTALYAILLSTGLLAAQEGPVLLVKQAGKQEPVALTRLQVDVRIAGFVSETRMTMTFFNPHDRVLEGDLVFPLPEGVLVSGYALDVGGVMVDGVAVEKEKGRRTFETEVRKGVDPGLMEWAKGNSFRTRVYPVPARGSRTVMVRYVSDLELSGGEVLYRLPMKHAQPVGEFSIKVEVARAEKAPLVKGGALANFQFSAWRSGFLAETSIKDATLKDDLVVALPDVERRAWAVEKSRDGSVYFCVHDMKAGAGRPGASETPRTPSRVTVLWDSSGSRGGAEHKAETDLLRAYFDLFRNSAVDVDLVRFRNAAEKPVRFNVKNGDSSNLIDAIQKTQYDGGTSMGATSPGKGDPAPDCYLLFSDGLSNFGKSEPSGFGAPVYAFSNAASADFAFMRWLAASTGGDFVDLRRVKVGEALAAMGKDPYQLIRATVGGAGAEDFFPSMPQIVHGPVSVAGRTRGGKAEVILHYGTGGKVLHRRTFVVEADGAPEGETLRAFWAQKKIAELMVFQDKNEKEIAELGKAFGLVTPGTSLLVLETLSQYVEHGVAPPETLPAMRAEYERLMGEKAKVERKTEQGKLERILAMWKDRVTWWEKSFTYPPDFRYRESERKKSRNGGGGHSEDLRRSNEPVPTVAGAMPPRPSPASESVGAGMDGPPREAGGGGAAAKMADSKTAGEGASSQPAIAIQAWNPQTPYLEAIRAAKPGDAFLVYMAQREKFGQSPGFFLDCADFFFDAKQAETGLQVLSNVAELQLEDAALLRVLAHRLEQLDYLELGAATFETVLKIRPEEPQSWRDLALVLERRGEFARSLKLLAHVVMNQWDRFDGIEVIALMEFNAMVPKAKAAGVADFPLDDRLVKLLDVDVRITLTWDADLTDMDLWVTEPSGEKAYYGHPSTTIGGRVSKDFTQGYGPEEYCVRKAMHGTYSIEANYFGSAAQTVQGPVTLQLDVFTRYGRPDQRRKSITIRLTERKETFKVGEIEF